MCEWCGTANTTVADDFDGERYRKVCKIYGADVTAQPDRYSPAMDEQHNPALGVS